MDARNKQYNNKQYNRRDYYTEGTAARKLAVVPEPKRRVERQESPQIERKIKRVPKVSQGIDLFSLLVLFSAMAITLFICYDYLRVQGNIIQLRKDITNLESTYCTLASENIALEESLTDELDWDKVFMTAVSELGMVYPNKNEVISYTAEEKGYVIQYKDIPE